MSCRWVYRSVVEIDNWVDRSGFFLMNIVSWIYLMGYRLNFVSHWKSHSLIFSRLWLRWLAEVSMSWTTEKKNLSSANNLHLLLMSFDKSLIYITNNKGPKIDPCCTPARTSAQGEHWPLKTTSCFLALRKSAKILIILPQMLLWHSWKINQSYHILSKALDISRNIPQTSRPISKTLNVSWLIERSWLI